ncbi:phosphate signaling complex protein PhoU [Desulfoluna butyratoxydans]|uniref:Phosphate-specific transport system accessory protein PhoU n=1 Tax=Desulfoluna butyratoxydans TaxID=231438 RepID=A0A4U8YKC8_9BACT|nr:phosphate signaling complex protein PhoU [Desulfoluna butyratoxydans]VFQ43824.1 phosphate transport system protein phou [Desulfoluna butyratoxydans]
MTIHLQRELDKIRRMLLSLGALTEDRFRLAIRALNDMDLDLAREIIEKDEEIDLKEVQIEEECLKVLALHQPVAGDLRSLVVVIKINNDLERIADQAVNIAVRIKTLASKKKPGFTYDYTEMADKAGLMLKMSLDAFVRQDDEMAEKVRFMDEEVDAMRNAAYDRIKEVISQTPDEAGYLINLFLVSRHLERIADHATNIAEEVIYMRKGEIIRHTEALD